MSYAHVKIKVCWKSDIGTSLLFVEHRFSFSSPRSGVFTQRAHLGSCVLGESCRQELLSSSGAALSSWRKLWNAEVEPLLSRIQNLCSWFIYIGGRCGPVPGLLRTGKMYRRCHKVSLTHSWGRWSLGRVSDLFAQRQIINSKTNKY